MLFTNTTGPVFSTSHNAGEEFYGAKMAQNTMLHSSSACLVLRAPELEVP